MNPQGRRSLALAIVLIGATAAAGQPPSDEASPRVRGLLAQMTREEKLAVIRGTHEPEAVFMGQAGWIRGVPRLGIPDLRFADGPPGVLVRRASTGMPATLAVAATFSRAEAAANGAVIGRDARALGVDVILQPYINLYRDATFERAYNTLGEDPVLTGTMAAEFVVAAQRENVMAQAKHYVAYDGADDTIVDGQALREVYIAPFKAVVDAGVASIMCSYNRINGIFSCGNEATLKGILRGELAFKGFVTSDWGATHGAEFIARGLDMEQPGTGPWAFLALAKEPEETGMSTEEVDNLEEIMFFGVPEEQRYPVAQRPEAPPRPPEDVSAKLGEALARGSVVEADIDRATGHVLRQLERFGWLDHAPRHTVVAQDIEANARIIQQTTERGAVLLKNEGVLPLKRADLDSLALIGPGALQTFAIVTGQEQSYGRPEREVGAWHALKALTKSDGLKLAVANDMTGVPVPSSALSNLKRVDAPSTAPATDIDFTRRSGRALPAGTNIKWSGTLSVPAAGDYEISLQLLGATGKLGVDGKIIAQMGWWGGHGDIVFANRDNVIPTTDGLDNLRRPVKLSAGPHAITVEATADSSGDPVQVRLAWVTPEMKARAFADAIQAARTSKFAVVFAWSRNRPFFGLPGDQDRLIAEVAAVNKNTIVVLNTGQPVAMPWLKDVRAVLEMWYTGDEGGWAAANLLTGKVSPAGRLPITWPRRLEDGPANDPAHPERSSFGVDGRTQYAEGIHIGYRWFDRERIEPLFPFGFGLSYARFEYSRLSVLHAADGGLDVVCTVKNVGARASDEVVQVYLGAPEAPPAGVDFAVRALADFERITLRPGQAKRVPLHVAPDRLRSWSNADSAWHVFASGRKVYVGASSRDLRLELGIPE
ncbi:MAG TPA: glycoside hydrolase family 3 C-terminal domain-containing protein [Steroidobacteraceae bacterium]|nr:glycoside hydrolase family 3 C-terminal domain-containing protein [Steroidobacteraceae bacterium]